MKSKPMGAVAPLRSAISVQILTQFGLDHGLSVERCLAGTGLNWQLLGDLGAEVEAQQELLLIRNLVTALGHIPGIGLQAGLRYRLHTYGIWGFAMLSSPDLRSAFQIAMRYLDLTYVFHDMHVEEKGDELHLILDDRCVPQDLCAFILERDCAGAMSIERDLTNECLPILSATFRTQAPADLRPYQELFGITPTFNAAENRIIKDSRNLDLMLPGGNALAVQQCEEQCKALLTKRRKHTGVSGHIRDRLLVQSKRPPDMEQLASELHMTSRTLRRRLEDEGTNFRQLQDEVRQALAEELLAIGDLSLEEIAERLGYSEVSNFIHAFKRWKGVTPRQFRC